MGQGIRRTARWIVLVLIIFRLADAHSEERLIHGQHEVLTGDYFGQSRPGLRPELFAPFIVAPRHHKHSAPAFSPDGNEVFFSLYPDNEYPQQIFVMRRVDGQWTNPQPAPFSRPFQEGGPVFSADGSNLFFNSKRPIDGSDNTLEHNDIWYVERTENGWSEAVNPGPPLNTPGSEYAGFLGMDGEFYFTREMPDGNYDIFESKLSDGLFSLPQDVGAPLNTATSFDSHPVIARDGAYMIFTSFRRKGEDDLGLYISLRQDDGSWSEAQGMGDAINNGGSRFAGLSADGTLMFFTSLRSGKEEYYWVDTEFISEHIRITQQAE